MADSSPITLELTGALERVIGRSHVTLHCSQEQPATELFRRLLHEYPALKLYLGRHDGDDSERFSWPRGFLLVRDSQMLPSSPDTIVYPGDRLTLIQMISGGVA
jgi:hypothetical protein